MKILVTGADGFIGSHLVEALVRAGYETRLSFSIIPLIHGVGLTSAKMISGKFLKFLQVFGTRGIKEAMSGCDAVLHLAALIAIPYSYHSPTTYVDTNIKGTLNILQAARGLDVSRIVHTSTSEVYGTAKFVPMTEEHPLQGQSPYSATKIAADQIAYSYYSSFNSPVVIVRPFNTYGPRQSARAVIPAIISQIASGKRKIQLGAVSPTRDFNYVQDTVDGFISVLQAKDGIGEAINFGSNYEISMGDTAKLIAEVMSVDIEIVTDEDRLRPINSEVERLWADNSKAKQLFGWEPRFAGKDGLKTGISETVQWFSKPENLKRYKSDLYNL